MKLKSMIEKMTIAVICGIVVFGAIGNYHIITDIIKPDMKSATINNIEKKLKKAESKYQENFIMKNELKDVYGILQRGMDKKIIGSFEYVKDDNQMIHKISEKPYKVGRLLKGMEKLKDITSEKGVPLLYVQMPNRECFDNSDKVNMFNIDDKTMNQILEGLDVKNIDYLDMRAEIINKEHVFETSEVFFRTDLHMQTDPEIWIAQQIINYIKENYKIESPEEILIQDMGGYTKKTYPFIGNYGAYIGKHYVPIDSFDLYYPIFQTNMVMSSPVSGLYKEGAFQNVVMNQYKAVETDPYIYWVTNYLQFMNPWYTIQNRGITDEHKVLFVIDSTAFRTVSYLSLIIGETTIVDPRYFDDSNYLEEALEDDWDAVIVCQGTFLTNSKFFN